MWQVLRNLKPEENAAELMKTAEAEIALGRLRGPMQVTDLDFKSCAIATRFGVDQGALRF